MKKLLCILLLLMIPASAWGADYYVNGSVESSGDGSYPSPFKTIAECTTAMSSSGGDTCYVMAGTYEEQIAAKSGTEGHKNTYAAYQGQDAILTRQVSLYGKNDVRILGFKITDTNQDASPHGIIVNNSLRCDIINNTIYNTKGQAIRDNGTYPPGTLGARYLTIRGNTMTMLGCREVETETCIGTHAMTLHGNHILVENNIITRPGGDFFDFYGHSSIIRNNNFSDFSFSYFPGNDGTAHPDVIQAYGSTTWPGYRVFYESNYSGSISDADAHFIQIRYLSDGSDMYDWTIRGNLANSIGSYFHQLEGIDSVRMYNNSFLNAVNTSVFGLATYASIGNYHFNNLFYETNGIPINPYNISSLNGSSITASNNACVIGSTHSSCAVNTDPLFTDYSGSDFTIQSGSPAKNAGKAITLANGAAAEATTTLVVDDAAFFTDGMGITTGDTIKVGSNDPVIVTGIDYDTNTITISAAQTWADDAGIYWRNQDTSPDIGAYEYDADGYDYAISLSPKSGAISGTQTLTATVTNSDAVRFVEFWIDGVPVATDTTSPYTYDLDTAGLTGNHTVKAIAYSLYASETPFKSDGGTVTIGTGTYYTLTLTIAGDGSGVVASDPAGIDTAISTTYQYAEGQEVTLTATPSGDDTVAWSGTDGSECTGLTCTVTMSAARAVTATFTDVAPVQWVVTRSYVGSGSTSPAEGDEVVNNDATATTTQTPSDHWTFSGWSGTCGCTGTDSCAPTVTANCTIIATWAEDAKKSITITFPDNGELIVSDKCGLYCGQGDGNYDCACDWYAEDVTLTCTPATGYYGCTMTGDDCTSGVCTPNDQTITVTSTNGRAATINKDGATATATINRDGSTATATIVR